MLNFVEWLPTRHAKANYEVSLLDILPITSLTSQSIFSVFAKNCNKNDYTAREKAPHDTNHTIADEYEVKTGEPTLNKWPSIPRSDKTAL